MSTVITAASLEETLGNFQQQGTDPQVIDHVREQPPEMMSQYISQLRQNPAHTVESLQQSMTAAPQRQTYQPTPTEQGSVEGYHPEFQRWSLQQMRKLRQPNAGAPGGFQYRGFAPDDNGHYQENLRDNFGQLHDWYQSHSADNPNFNLASVNLAQATGRSAEWHRAMAGQGEGKHYLPYTRDERGNVNDPRIVHRFDDGHFIANVDNQNDLDVEGNRMSHCVSGYGSQVASGKARIFSLRDPRNRPHATVEMDGKENIIQQIKGFANKKPKVEHRDRLNEWLGTLHDPRWTGNDRDTSYDDEVYFGSGDPDDIRSGIHESFYGPYHDESDPHPDYDVPFAEKEGPKPEDADIDDIYQRSLDAMSSEGWGRDKRRTDEWDPDHQDSANLLAELAVDSDKARLKNLIASGHKVDPNAWRKESQVAALDDRYEQGIQEHDALWDGEPESDARQALREKQKTTLPHAWDAALRTGLSQVNDPEYAALHQQALGAAPPVHLSPEEEDRQRQLKRMEDHAALRKRQPGLFDHVEDYPKTMPQPSHTDGQWAYASLRHPRRRR